MKISKNPGVSVNLNTAKVYKSINFPYDRVNLPVFLSINFAMFLIRLIFMKTWLFSMSNQRSAPIDF